MLKDVVIINTEIELMIDADTEEALVLLEHFVRCFELNLLRLEMGLCILYAVVALYYEMKREDLFIA